MNIMFLNLIEVISNLDQYAESFLTNLGAWGALIGSLLIVIESILPCLPLCVFITLNFFAFGNIIGLIMSWLCTCLGCYISFLLFRSKIKGWFEKKLRNKKLKKQVNNLTKYIDKISLSGLAVLVAIPFTPAFAVNIAAGLSNISKKKFITAIFIGKLFMVYFWGYVGTTLVECLTHPIYLVKILILMLIAFIISKVVNKYLNID